VISLRITFSLAALLLAIHPCQAADPVQVTRDAYLNYMPSLIQRQDRTLMIVYERLDSNYENGDLIATFSDDGVDWTEPLVVIANPANERHPSLVQLADGSYRCYFLSDASSSYKIYQAASADGLHWTEPALVDLGWTSEQLVNPTVCAEADGSMTMAYDRLSAGGYVAHSADGLAWDHDRTLIGSGSLNRIMRHSNGTYVASYQRRTGAQYWQIDIFTKTSSDRVHWGPEMRVTYTYNSHDSFPLELGGSHFTLYYATSTGGQPYDLYSRTSEDGTNWADEQNWVPYEGWDTQPHPIRLASGAVAMAWARGPTQTTMQVYFVQFEPAAAIGDAEWQESLTHITASPNPSSGAIRLTYALGHGIPMAGSFEIEILDPGGRRIRSLHADPRAGSIWWDGTDAGGRPLATGCYIVRLSAFEQVAATRVLRIR